MGTAYSTPERSKWGDGAQSGTAACTPALPPAEHTEGCGLRKGIQGSKRGQEGSGGAGTQTWSPPRACQGLVEATASLHLTGRRLPRQVPGRRGQFLELAPWVLGILWGSQWCRFCNVLGYLNWSWEEWGLRDMLSGD